MEQCTWQTCAFSDTESEWTINCPDLKDPECSGYMTEGGVTIAECAAPSTCTATLFSSGWVTFWLRTGNSTSIDLFSIW